MRRIQTLCLGHKEKFTGKYESLEILEKQISQKYEKYLTQVNVTTTEVPFILTYKNEETKREEILTNIDVIPNNYRKWFQLNVKRIWDTCCVCINSFGITTDQLPYECPMEECGYQYCIKCVELIKACNDNHHFFCLHCLHSIAQDIRVNQLLIDLLWKKYSRKYGAHLLETINMPGTLSNDIYNRMIHVQLLVQALTEKDNRTKSDLVQELIQRAKTFVENLKRIKCHIDTLAAVNNDVELENGLKSYSQELDGLRNGMRKCENFIEICELLHYHIQQMESYSIFPTLHKQMNEWENLLLTEKEFHPKAIGVFQALEEDLNRQIYPPIPCRVGLIGETSSGKTSLALALRQIQDDYSMNFQSRELPNKVLSSLVGVSQTTFCSLEFEHEYDNGAKVTFVDVEGSTDRDISMKSGNYFDEIRKTDCDLYIIVFEHNFTEIHRKWQEYIIKDMHRTCWIVRSKIDKSFIERFKQDVGQDFFLADDTKRTKYSAKVAEQLRASCKFGTNGNELKNIYFTSTLLNPKNKHDLDVSLSSYVQFDLEKLINDIQTLPPALHEARLQQMAVRATAKVINICFRRGYTLNTMKYKVSAGVAAVIPFLDLVPRYFARDKIRENFGVNSYSPIVKWWTGKNDEFLDYLRRFNIELAESDLKTSALRSTVKRNSSSTDQGTRQASSIVVETAAGVGVAGFTVSDDALRLVGVGSTGVMRGLSFGLIIFGGVLTAGMCAWSAVSNGRQMYDYLHRLCDDLIFISAHVAGHIISKNHAMRASFANENVD